jgi:hypothetical protein
MQKPLDAFDRARSATACTAAYPRRSELPRIGVILGSARPGRRGEKVAAWVMGQTRQRSDAEFELVDLADYPLPHLDEPRMSRHRQ